LTNPSSSHVIFKVKTTAPDRYIVRPPCAIVAPNDTFTVLVYLQSQEGSSRGSMEKDKFKIFFTYSMI
ncbi:vesicle-associated membrane-protein-associated protein, partial [Kipferlia bialata]